MTFFVGLDWAATTHAVCVLDQTGLVRWRGTVPHSADGLAELVQILARAWVRVLWRCWQDRRPYNVTQHRGAQPLLALQSQEG
jgi:hypothetical protein